MRLSQGVKWGTQTIFSISALRGGNAERLLKAVATASSNSCNTRVATEWSPQGDGVEVATVTVRNETESREVTLVVGKRIEEGLFLEDIGSLSQTHHMSLKPRGGKIFVPAGLLLSRLNDYANKLVSLAFHGTGWFDRVGAAFEHPYGLGEPLDASLLFRVIDGGVERSTLGNVIKRGAIRSTHVGAWKPYSTVAALCGATVLLHEVAERSERVIRLNGVTLSSSPESVWAPYAHWDKEGKRELGSYLGEAFHDVIAVAATPFAFHVHATLKQFPSVQLASDFALCRIGLQRLHDVLAAIANDDPERFYRLVDCDGVTRRLERVEKEVLVFEGDRSFPIGAIADNVLSTFTAFAAVQRDPSLEIEKKERIIPDSHVYIVLFGCAEANGDVAHHLGGSDMYRYLTKGDDARMHRVRNHRLFGALRGRLGATSVNFHVYPPLSLGEGEAPSHQYVSNLHEFDPARWKDRTLISY